MIRGVIEDRSELARWEAMVRNEFRQVPWSSTCRALLSSLGIKLNILTIIPERSMTKKGKMLELDP